VADNVMGGDEEVNLGLNVNLGLDRSIQDAATLADQIKEMRSDQEAFANSMADTKERLSQLTSEYQTQLDLRRQMIDAETQLRNISEATKQNASNSLESYRELNNVVSNLAMNIGRIGGIPGAPSGGGSGGGGAGGGGGGGASGGSGAGGASGGGGGGGSSGNLGSTSNEGEQQGQTIGKFLARVFKVDKETARNWALGLGEIGSYAATVKYLYGIGANAANQQNIFSGLTGGSTFGQAMGYDINAQEAAGFGLNPFESYGEAKQIRMNALAQGYGQNTGLYNQAVQFGDFAQQTYNMSPKDSAAMFQQMVVQAGTSVGTLVNALDTLGSTASKTQSSFQAMQASYLQAAGAATAMGFNGNMASAAGMANAMTFVGQSDLQGYQTPFAQLGESMIGQAMLANAAGTSYSNLTAFAQGFGGTGTAAGNSLALMNAGNAVFLRLFANFGIHPGMNSFDLYRASMFARQRLSMELDSLGFKPKEGGSYSAMSATQFYKFVSDVVNGRSTAAATTANKNAAISTYQNLENFLDPNTTLPASQGGVNQAIYDTTAAGKFGSYGVTSLAEQAGSKLGYAAGNVGFEIGGRFISQSQFNSLSPQEQQAINMQALMGNATVAEMVNGKIKNSGQSVLGAFGQQTNFWSSSGMSNNPQAAVATLELGPQAAKLFQIMSNPSQFAKWWDNYVKSTGGKQ